MYSGFFKRYNAIVHLIEYSIVNVTFICTGKLKIGVTYFIALIWNKTFSISEKCLCMVLIQLVDLIESMLSVRTAYI